MMHAEPPRTALMRGSSIAGARPERDVAGGHAVSTHRERVEQKRREKLELIREQLAKGDLTIRQMTPAERAMHPPRPAAPRRRQW